MLFIGALFVFVGCSAPSNEDLIKESLEKQLNKEITAVVIKDTLMVSDLNKSMIELDSIIQEMELDFNQWEALKTEQEKLLNETQQELANAGHPALVFGFEETIRQIETNLIDYNSHIEQNREISAELSMNKKRLEEFLNVSVGGIGVMNITATQGEGLVDYVIDSDFKIIE